MGALVRQPSLTVGPAALAFLGGLVMLGGIGGIVAASMSAVPAPAEQPASALSPVQSLANHQADETAVAAFINQVALSHVAFGKASEIAANLPAPKATSPVKKTHSPVHSAASTPPPRPLVAAAPLPAPAAPAVSEGFSLKQLVPAVDYLPSPGRVADDVVKQAGRLLSW